MARSRRGGYEAGGPVTRAEDFPVVTPGLAQSGRGHHCWWDTDDLLKALGRIPIKTGDRVPCYECGHVWEYKPGDQQWRTNPYPPGWVPVCPACDNTGHVCENHPDKPWGDLSDTPTACHCGGAGMPCPTCCDPIPEDGRHSILEAFMPRHLKRP